MNSGMLPYRYSRFRFFGFNLFVENGPESWRGFEQAAWTRAVIFSAALPPPSRGRGELGIHAISRPGAGAAVRVHPEESGKHGQAHWLYGATDKSALSKR